MPDTPDQKLKAISFADFGVNFMNLVVTEQVLQEALEQAVPKTMTKSEGGLKAFNAKADVTVGAVRREASADGENALRFSAPLNLFIKLEILLAGLGFLREPHDVHAEPTLEFMIYCVEPLGVKIDIAPVSPDSFKLVIARRGLAQLFGQVEPPVREAIAGGINEAVKGAADALYIDILAKVQDAMNAPAGPRAGDGADEPSKPTQAPVSPSDGAPIEATPA